MPMFRKKPVVVEAHEWTSNGSHPNDFSDRDNSNGSMTREGLRSVVCRSRQPGQGCADGTHGEDPGADRSSV